jgi:hypothetical protein
MRGHVHVFDARVGGAFRISLTYQEAEHPVGGKTSADTDAFEGRFIDLVPLRKDCGSR